MAEVVDLNPKLRHFADEFLANGRNGKRAAIAAGYAEKSAEVTASRLLRNAKVDAYITAREKALQRKLELRQENVLELLRDMAFADFGELYDENNTLKPVKDWPLALRRLVAGVEVFEEFEGSGEERTQIGLTKKVKLLDRVKVLEMAMRHFGLFKSDNEQVGGSIADRLAAARARVEARKQPKEVRNE